ncbi:MAG: pyruvate ferredoxin oxidoreductase, partial [Lachnospiraceae bacterium]|nr:pyruvate ferredoxin oxidoreductase [Lachnospiraceae bacterium]
ACYDLENRPLMINIVYGLAGRDVAVNDVKKVYDYLLKIAETGDPGEVYLHMGQRSSEKEVF